jgi:hypothetical protein
MEAPPQNPPPLLPRAPRRLGRTILLIVLAPLVLLGLGMAVAGGLHIKDAAGYFGLVFVAACICSIAGAAFICVAATKSIGARIFIFLASAVVLIVVYSVCIFSGCEAVSGPLNFH